MKIIASDFDGTIYRNGKITEADRNAVLNWQKAGNKFGIVTGRGEGILETLEELGIKLDYAISENGAVVLDGNGNLIYEDWFKRGIAHEYFEFAYSTGFKFKNPNTHSEDPNDERKEHQLTLRLEDGLYDDAKELAEILNKHFDGRLTSYSNGHWINTVKYGTSKATGIRHYASHINVDDSCIFTVGDYLNDLPMLTKFNGYVVSTCYPEMKKYVPNVCRDIEDLVKIALSE